MSLLLRVVRDLVGLLLAGAFAVLVFLLFTDAGARIVLRELEARLGIVHAEGTRGRLWGPIAFDRFRYEDELVRVVLDDVRLDWSPLQALMRNIAVSELHAAAVIVEIKQGDGASGSPDDDAGALTRLPVQLDVRALRVARFELRRPDAEPMRFDDLRLAGSWLDAAVRITELAAVTPWLGPLRVETEAQLLPDGVDFAALRVSGFGDVHAEGRLGYTSDSDLRVAWTGLHWPPSGEPAVVSDDGRLHWTGRFDDWRFETAGSLAFADERLQIEARGSGSSDVVAADALRVESRHGSVAGRARLSFGGGYDAALVLEAAGERLQVDAAGTLSADGLVADALGVDTGHGRVSGRAQLDWSGALAVDAAGRMAGMQPEHWLPQIQGTLNGDFELQAEFSEGAPQGRFRLALGDSLLYGYPLQLSAAGRYADDALSLERFDLRSGPSRLQGSGRVWPDLDAQATLDSSQLASLWPELGGRARARLRLDGPLKTPHAVGQVHAEALLHESVAVDAIDASFDVDPRGQMRVDAEVVGIDAGPGIDRLQLSLRGRAGQHRLSVDARLPQGAAAATVDGSFDAGARRWQGTLTSARLAPRGFAPWALEEAAALSVSGAAVELSPACFGSEVGRVCAALRPLDAARRVAFRAEALQLSALDPWLAGVHVDGRLDGHGYVDLGDGGIRDLRLDLDTSATTLARAGLPPLQLLPGRIDVREQGRELIVAARIPFEQGGLRLDAELAPGDDFMQRALSGTLRVDVPQLSWLRLFNPELQQVQGRIDGRIALDGTPAAPALDGRVELADGALRLRTPGIALEQVRAMLRGGTGGALTLEASARSDGGELRVDGRIDLSAEAPTLALDVRGERFQAVRTPDAAVWVSPQLDLRLAGGELRVEGSVDVPRARITPKTIEQGVAPSADQIIVRRGEDAPDKDRLRVYADIRLSLGDDVRFDGLGLTTQLAGGMRLHESPGVPTRARGELRLVGGRYEAYGQSLTIETGRLLFTGSTLTEPAVEIRATRQPREDITVGVLVRGRLDEPELSLFSTPAMPQERQLAWLVLGRPLDEATGSADRAVVADAALSLGLSGGEWIAQRFGGKLGLDEVTLGAQPGQSSDQAQLTLGKYLSPDLFISYGVSLFQSGYTFRLQYDIGGGFKLATETGADSGGDLLYTIER